MATEQAGGAAGADDRDLLIWDIEDVGRGVLCNMSCKTPGLGQGSGEGLYSMVWPANKVNWIYASTQREDTSCLVFLASSSGTFARRLQMPLCLLFSRHILPVQMLLWDQKTGRFRGYGFVSFRNQQGSRRHTDGSLNQAGRGCHCRIGSATVNLLHTTSHPSLLNPPNRQVQHFFITADKYNSVSLNPLHYS